MGMFSWKTADTQESVWATGTDYYDSKKVPHLLQPNGESPIPEPEYDGYGVFGGVDAYEWLARKNLPSFGIMEERFAHIPADTLRIIGIDLNSVSRSNEMGHDDFHFPTGFKGVLENYGFPADEISIETLPYPIKISFNPNAQYEHLDASDSCPYQGFLTGNYERDLGVDDPFAIYDEDEFNLN